MYKIEPIEKIKKSLYVSADKSISHRAVIISSLTKGSTIINNFLTSYDTLTTLNCLRQLSVRIKNIGAGALLVSGYDKYFPKKNTVHILANQSGTTIRIISGILVGQLFGSIITAQGSLKNRPMKRITEPLRMMGADIKGKAVSSEEYSPLVIKPVSNLVGIRYNLPLSSAQVKSAILLSSLFAKGFTEIKQPSVCRDHTERMLKLFGAKIKCQGRTIVSSPCRLKSPASIFIPGDFSSAAFFIVLSLLTNKSKLTIKTVGINPTRIGLLKVLLRMGCRIKIYHKTKYFEPYADIDIESSRLTATTVQKEEISSMIDEVPLLFVCAAFAHGTTKIYGLGELKVKETDRIVSMVYNLKQAGVDITASQYRGDWRVIIEGIEADKKKLKPARFKSFSDHRTAMSMIIFAMVSGQKCAIDEIKCIAKSFPDFMKILKSLS